MAERLDTALVALLGAIKCIVGDVGSGKTTKCVMDAILAAQKGRDVYMNFPLTPKLEKDYPWIAKHIHYVEDFYGFLLQREQEAYDNPISEFRDLLVIDEAWAVWNARRTGERKQIALIDYVSISRKLGLELLVASQLARRLDPVLKDLVTIWIIAEKKVKRFKVTVGGKTIVQKRVVGFTYEYYDPDTKASVIKKCPIRKAEQYFPYYTSTAMTSIGPMMPMGRMGKEDRAITARQWKVFKKTYMADMKEFRKAIKQVQLTLTQVVERGTIQEEGRDTGVPRAHVKGSKGNRKISTASSATTRTSKKGTSPKVVS